MDRVDWKIAKAVRKMERRREKCMALRVATKLAAVAILTASAVMFSGAYSQPTETVHDVYIVQEGDTLWNLTEKYRERDRRDPYIFDYMDEIKRLNPQIEENKCQVFPGQVLRIEYEVRAEQRLD